MKTNLISRWLMFFLVWMIVFCSACKEKEGTNVADDSPILPEVPGYAYTDVHYVRIAALGSSSGGGSWMLNRRNGLLKDYTADDVLEFINILKPDRLERFITSQLNPGATLPVRTGSPSMTVQQFLNAAVKSGSADCRIIPELNLQWIADNERLFWETAQAYLNMQLERPIRSVYLNGWVAYCKNIHQTAEQRTTLLQRLRNLGYEDIFADFTGNLEANHPYITGAYLNIDPQTWRANGNWLEKMKSYSNIGKVLVHINSPETMDQFKLKTTDQQADILCNTLYPNQKTQEYNFVFPVMEGDFNSRMVFTGSENYKENSLFEVTRDLITKGAFQGNNAGSRDEEDPPLEDSDLPEKYIRMVVWADEYQSDHWKLTRAKNAPGTYAKDYTAEDVLEMIEEIKPDCLERFITGTGAITSKDVVPVRAGNPPMTLVEFLQKAQDAGAEGCFIMPKLNLKWLVNNKDNPLGDNLFWRSAQALYDLPLNPPIRAVSLDVWNEYVSNFGITERDAMFKKLRDMGYTKIFVNYSGNSNANHSEVDWACFNITKSNMTVNENTLKKLQGYANLEKVFLYIDYPGAMDEFKANTPDRQADIYCKNIYPLQTKGFIFVYGIFHANWDANAPKTSVAGPYKGKTIYEISKELMLYGKVLDD